MSIDYPQTIDFTGFSEKSYIATRTKHYYFTRQRLTYDIAVFLKGEDLLGALASGQRFDIYMLDIIMPGLDGIELAATLRVRGETGAIVFITTTADYAIKGYSVRFEKTKVFVH